MYSSPTHHLPSKIRCPSYVASRSMVADAASVRTAYNSPNKDLRITYEVRHDDDFSPFYTHQPTALLSQYATRWNYVVGNRAVVFFNRRAFCEIPEIIEGF